MKKQLFNKIICCIFSMFFIAIVGCSDDKNPVVDGGDEEPVLPADLEFDKFYPTDAKAGDLITIEGKGFGSDVSKVFLELNYRPAEIESFSDTKITFFVPENATRTGYLRVQITDKNVDYKFLEEFHFRIFSKYTKVSTISEVIPVNFEHHYGPFGSMTYDGDAFFFGGPWSSSGLVRLENGIFSTPVTSDYDDKFQMAMSLDKNTIYQCQTTHGKENPRDLPSIIVLKREDNFTIEHAYVRGHEMVTGLAVNPVDGEVFYFDKIWGPDNTKVFRIDHNTKTGVVALDRPAPLYNNQNHPEGGDYINWKLLLKFSNDGEKLYMMATEGPEPWPSAIWEVEYDFETKSMKEDTQRLLCGSMQESAYVDGNLSSARFDYPIDLVTDKAGNIYVADRNNHCIRKITPDGTVSTFAGKGGVSGYQDGTSEEALFDNPTALIFDEENNESFVLYVLDAGNKRLRKIEQVEEEFTE